MKVRAVVPSFIDVDMVKSRLQAVVPGVQVAGELVDDGPGPMSEVEILALTPFTPIPEEALGRYPKLRFLQVAGTGYNNVPLELCQKRGIRVSNVQGANAKSVAEHVIMVTLALLRDLGNIDKGMREGFWPPLTGGHDLAGKVFGIVGSGRIGKEVARRLIPFEVSVIYYDKFRLKEDEERTLGLTYVELPELVASSDIISLHLPLSSETKGILGAKELASMKDDAILVNTARSELVDLVALKQELGKGRIRAALDVYPEEPPNFQDDLFKYPATVFTPHSAGVTLEAQERLLTEALRNVLRFASGKDPLYEVKA
ncbi:MAG: hydroxyacid dehydrogenase [Euryarchaeota archaeon]|nr:hydroxyacid dehydrogenase [Euryarchaeota archaeon]MDE1838209.1 hydroxyacid dehydrogenase [Euryarchaeota archaeon]MDE2046435.1 hydroxyacid dehydrogenase [Thermoplasmata archaeon]